jgi:hypothetical protein
VPFAPLRNAPRLGETRVGTRKNDKITGVGVAVFATAAEVGVAVKLGVAVATVTVVVAVGVAVAVTVAVDVAVGVGVGVTGVQVTIVGGEVNGRLKTKPSDRVKVIVPGAKQR